MKRSSSLRALLALTAVGLTTAALADNPLGAYVGAGVGASNVGNSYDYGYYGRYHDDDVAWKAIAGIRPIPWVGAEAEWIDFGSGHGDNGYYGFGDYYANSVSHPKAAVLYGIGYLPLPLPFLDVYGKAGVARLQTDLTTYQYTSGGYCPPPYSSCPAPSAFRIDQWNTKFAWGAGVGTHWQDFGFRAEYERIQSQYGNPSAFTVNATWTF
jgi:hypothetical protein